MTARQFLRRARGVDREIDTLIEAKQRTRDRLLQITQTYERSEAQTTKDLHKFDKLVEYENQIDQKIDELVALKIEINTVIAKLKNRNQRIALASYYVDMKTWEQVAVDMHYSYQHIMYIHKNALIEVDKLLKQQDKTE